MDDKKTVNPDDFKRCADFHGHVCPGLSIGFKAAKAGMEWLQENRATDEELVTIVETDACGVDAIQVLTGCTFGKGNLIYKDYGKQAFTFLGRDSGKGVRLALKAGVIDMPDEDRSLMQKIREDTATDEEREKFWAGHTERSKQVLEKSVDELFSIEPVETDLPSKAKIEPSIPCTLCGEPTMSSKMEEVSGGKLCRSCAGSQ
jgi:formylmethanofuran dehydrogenase subunit E